MSDNIPPLEKWASHPTLQSLEAIKQELPKLVPTVDTILKERGSRYGSFRDNSRISQELAHIVRKENAVRPQRTQIPLTYYELEAIEMIFHKIARIVSGDDPSYADNWDDIAGYAHLGKVPR